MFTGDRSSSAELLWRRLMDGEGDATTGPVTPTSHQWRQPSYWLRSGGAASSPATLESSRAGMLSSTGYGHGSGSAAMPRRERTLGPLGRRDLSGPLSLALSPIRRRARSSIRADPDPLEVADLDAVPPLQLLDEDEVELTEDDVPGAKLTGDPSALKVVELQRWLRCRDLPTRGNKAALVALCVAAPTCTVAPLCRISRSACACFLSRGTIWDSELFASLRSVHSTLLFSAGDMRIVDPDNGANRRRKLEMLNAAHASQQSEAPFSVFEALQNDSGWVEVKGLSDVPAKLKRITYVRAHAAYAPREEILSVVLLSNAVYKARGLV